MKNSNNKLNFRSVVFQRAYIIVKQTGCTLGDALKEAWSRYRTYRNDVVKEITERVENFDYTYQYSDDYRVGKRWRAEAEKLNLLIKKMPAVFAKLARTQVAVSDYEFI